MLTYIGSSRYWYERVRDQIDDMMDKYSPDRSESLTQRFERIPIEAWETELPLLDYCLRDSIRLQLGGTMYRRNVSGYDVKIGNEVIPNGAFAVSSPICIFRSPILMRKLRQAYQISDIHLDPEVYPEPLKWDPGRHLPERAEEKKKPNAFVGWGSGKHPCLGTRVSYPPDLDKISICFCFCSFSLSFVRDAAANVCFPASSWPDSNSSLLLLYS